MKFLGNIVFALAANSAALLAAASFIPDVRFTWHNDFVILIRTAGVITAINIFLKPIAKLFLGPFIVLSLGIAAIFLNAALLWLATFWAPELSFATIGALIYSTLLFAAVNFVFSVIGKRT